MPPLPQTAGGQSRFLCEPELMIRAVNVVPTATRLDVAGGDGGDHIPSDVAQASSVLPSTKRRGNVFFGARLLNIRPGVPLATMNVRTGF